MIHKFTLLITGCFYLITNANAVEKTKFYISSNYGVGTTEKIKYNHEDVPAKKLNAHMLNLAVGYRVAEDIRAELGYNFFGGLNYKVSKIFGDSNSIFTETYNQKLSANSLFASVYFDITNFATIKPYIGAGVGIAKVKAGDMKYSRSDDGQIEPTIAWPKGSKNQFAGHIAAGVNYEVNEFFDINLLRYNFHYLGNASTNVDEENSTLKAKLAVHSVGAGITIKF